MLFRTVIVVGLLAAAAMFGSWLGNLARTATPNVRVIEVVDGDTIVVEFANGATDTVRLLGVDTPETKHPTTGLECFGPEASAYTTERLLGQAVTLESDIERRDLYGRRLAYLTLDGERFNVELLHLGYARFLVIPPNDAYSRDLLAAELDARRHRRGLWREC